MKIIKDYGDKRWVSLETREEVQQESVLSEMPGVLDFFDVYVDRAKTGKDHMPTFYSLRSSGVDGERSLLTAMFNPLPAFFDVGWRAIYGPDHADAAVHDDEIIDLLSHFNLATTQVTFDGWRSPDVRAHGLRSILP